MKIDKIIIFAFLSFVINACGVKNEKDVDNTKTETINGVVTSTFKVWGNCNMCKETIEGSLKSEGILKADWNVDSKIMTIAYDDKTITLDQIQKNIASVGYDNNKYKGDDKAYDELHSCCQYDRK